MMSMMVSFFVLSFFPRGVLDEILNLLSQFLRFFLPTLQRESLLGKAYSNASGHTKVKLVVIKK